MSPTYGRAAAGHHFVAGRKLLGVDRGQGCVAPTVNWVQTGSTSRSAAREQTAYLVTAEFRKSTDASRGDGATGSS